ncbi:MAG: hypothetical protein AVDCRST_MAG01-01-4917, partial [uncultured Rubrobacteraceae bacterium]
PRYARRGGRRGRGGTDGNGRAL